MQTSKNRQLSKVLVYRNKYFWSACYDSGNMLGTRNNTLNMTIIVPSLRELTSVAKTKLGQVIRLNGLMNDSIVEVNRQYFVLQ